MGVVL
jgi:hypothetical protein